MKFDFKHTWTYAVHGSSLYMKIQIHGHIFTINEEEMFKFMFIKPPFYIASIQDWMVTFQSYFLHLFLLECWLFCYSSIWQGLEYFVSTFIFIGWRWNFNKLWEVCLCEVEFYFNFVLKVYLCLPLIYGTFWI